MSGWNAVSDSQAYGKSATRTPLRLLGHLFCVSFVWIRSWVVLWTRLKMVKKWDQREVLHRMHEYKRKRAHLSGLTPNGGRSCKRRTPLLDSLPASLRSWQETSGQELKRSSSYHRVGIRQPRCCPFPRCTMCTPWLPSPRWAVCCKCIGNALFPPGAHSQHAHPLTRLCLFQFRLRHLVHVRHQREPAISRLLWRPHRCLARCHRLSPRRRVCHWLYRRRAMLGQMGST